jgi:acetyltransferase
VSNPPALPMPSQSLAPFLLPRSVAVVGAGDRPTSSGGAVLRNLLSSGYAGRIVPVNPKGGELLGLRVATTLREVAPACELAVIVVRPDAILDVVREAADTGHRHLLVLPGGFAEGGEEGQARDRALRALAAEHRLTIAGPNSAGLINLLDAAQPYAATFFRALPRGGAIALISQSGAIAEEAIAASHASGIPLGAVVSVGNAMQLAVLDYLEALGDDPACKVVLLYAETFADAARFRASAQAVARRKPVVALIGGRTQAGRDAARRHTGSAAPTDAEAAALCRDAGVVRVTSLRELLLAGKALAAHPAGIGRRVLLLSNSGGPGVLCSDRCADEGLALPELPSALELRLRAAFPPEAVVANPLDLLADAREDRFGATLQAVIDEAGAAFDAILMIHVVPFMVDANPVIERLAQLAAAAQRPILHSMMGTLEGKHEWMRRMEAAGVPLFDNVEDMASAAGLLARHRELRASSTVIGGPQ